MKPGLSQWLVNFSGILCPAICFENVPITKYYKTILQVLISLTVDITIEVLTENTHSVIAPRLK